MKNRNETVIRVEATTFDGETRFVDTKGFWIDDESNKYQLHTGTLISSDNGMSTDWMLGDDAFFSTKDRDHDQSLPLHCADLFCSGWWYIGCFSVNLNGLYSQTETISKAKGITSRRWRGLYVEMKMSKMQIQ